MSRWIAISTDLLNVQHRMHPQSTNEEACRAFAWIDLIGMAAWRPHGGLKRGQVRVAQEFLATRWNWHRSKVQRFLDQLESERAISRDRPANNRPVIITICNYSAYQPSRSSNRSTDRSRHRSSNRSQVVEVDIETSSAHARGNGDPVDMDGAEARPDRIREIMEGLKVRRVH